MKRGGGEEGNSRIDTKLRRYCNIKWYLKTFQKHSDFLPLRPYVLMMIYISISSPSSPQNQLRYGIIYMMNTSTPNDSPDADR
jgi:hypothetical protein